MMMVTLSSSDVGVTPDVATSQRDIWLLKARDKTKLGIGSAMRDPNLRNPFVHFNQYMCSNELHPPARRSTKARTVGTTRHVVPRSFLAPTSLAPTATQPAFLTTSHSTTPASWCDRIAREHPQSDPNTCPRRSYCLRLIISSL